MKHIQDWQPAIVAATEDLTPTVRQFTLRSVNPLVTQWSSGAHLQVQVGINGQTQTRHYSLVGTSDARHWRIAVKRMEGGRGGSAAMWALQVGDTLPISGPYNHFALDLSAPAYLLIAGGIGVTPLVQMAQHLAVYSKSKATPIRMLYGVRTADELAFEDVLRESLGDRLQTCVASQGENIDFQAEIAALPLKAQLYTCGPVPMLEAIRSAWQAAGRRLADLRFETFGSSGSYAAQAFKVKIPRHQLDIMVPADTTLLEALENAGIDTISDCRRGECGLCAMDVVEVQGDLDHRDIFLSDHEKKQNNRMCVCVSRAVGVITLDSAWRAET